MKIYRENYADKASLTIRSAVEDALTPSAYSYEDKYEKLDCEVQLLRAMISRLVEQLYGNKDRLAMTDAEKVKEILGYDYEVEE